MILRHVWDNENDGSSNSVPGHNEKVLGFSILGGLGHSADSFPDVAGVKNIKQIPKLYKTKILRAL